MKLDDIGLHKIDSFHYKENVTYSRDAFKNIYIEVDDKAYILEYKNDKTVLRKR